jgi:glycerophosphoryl diester phosphodiesterase
MCKPGRKSAAINKIPNNMTTLPAFDLEGHRGCRGLMPENTIPAMIHALELGVTTLEMDVVITADNQVVLSHEPWMGHEIATTPDGRPTTLLNEKQHNIYKLDYATIKKYDVGLRTHPRFPQQKKMPAYKPLLTEVIDSVRAWCTSNQKNMPWFNIETKCLPAGDGLFHPKPGVFADNLMSVIRNKKIENHTIIQSFDFRTLQHLYRQKAPVILAMLIEDTDKRNPDEWIAELGFIPGICSPHYSLVNEQLVKWTHSKNMRLVPWTVNKPEDMQRLKDLGTDGLISDYPDLFTKLK